MVIWSGAMKRKQLQIPAGEFKAKCLQLMDEISRSRKELVITKRGKPVAKLVPFEDEAPEIFGFMKDSVAIKGDIVSPIDVDWEANQS
jgi:prevent-host-death family protein